MYLSQEKDFTIFLPGEPYETWESQEINTLRLSALKGNELDLLATRDDSKDNEILKKRQKDLRTVLSIIGKCVSQGHYNTVMRHSTSVEWIFIMLRSDYDIQKKGIHFFNILELKYDSTKITPISFYNQFRTLIVNHLSKDKTLSSTRTI